MLVRSLLTAVLAMFLAGNLLSGTELRVRISHGQSTPHAQPFHITLGPSTTACSLNRFQAVGGQRNIVQQGTWTGEAGGGQVATATFTLISGESSSEEARPVHVMWSDLMSHSDAATVERLSNDLANGNSAGGVKVLIGRDDPQGFTFTAHQLQRAKALWIPAYDLFITLDDQPVAFADYQGAAAKRDKTTLAEVAESPEASYAEYVSKWPDMGSPTYTHPHQPAPGHIMCLTWDSALPKFGIDRGAGVWNDYGNEDRFRFWFAFGDLTQGIIDSWRSQRLQDGLPVVTTTFERDDVRYEVEQFAYPLDGPPKERRGDIAVVLLQKVRLTNLAKERRIIPISMTHQRLLPIETGEPVEGIATERGFIFRDSARKRALLTIEGVSGTPAWHQTLDYQSEDKRFSRTIRFDATISEPLDPGQSREFIVKLPSPITDTAGVDKLTRLDYKQARAETLGFWSSWIARGAQFKVPEKAVNDLFNASLWHALRLPRRHGGEGPNVNIDLPYSNFAYDQTGIPWPGVHSIYVDYMLYELRGYPSVALEELLNEFRLNQDISGHVSGFANWMMYTPSMLFASGNYYLLSHDRKGFDELLPYALKALAWCEFECKRAQLRPQLTGMVEGPLNDGTGSGVWALNQAYMYAGLERFGTALAAIGHPKAQAVLDQAASFQKAVQAGIAQATAATPLVQIRDGSWQPLVPSDATEPRRLMDLWYPSDVDTGPLHLVRLKALPADGPFANFLLNDHEDNLFLKHLGMANEPVYEPQGLAYLYRDDPKAAIRTFYSQMACAFSQTVFEPVEHRWMHGQYFGPPSTDGSWFEMFRNMLVREVDDHTLILGQAAPRRWLEDGKEIEVSGAPTYFGPVSVRVHSDAGTGRISADVELPRSERLNSVIVRLRHPEDKPIHSVSINGQPSQAFDAAKEWITIDHPSNTRYQIVASY